MIKRSKNEGFTLIELLVTISIIVLLMLVAVVIIPNVILKSKEKKEKVNYETIKSSVVIYVDEFKKEDKYWINENGIQYACTTVGMLVNKGYLKPAFLEDTFAYKNVYITKDTSIKIERNIDTKVYDDIIFFNTDECKSDDLNLSFNLTGTHNEGYENWYNNDVKIEILSNDNSKIGDYEFLKNGNQSIDYQEYNSKENDWNILVGDQGENIDVCMNYYDIKDNNMTYCLSNQNDVYNMDKEKPSNPNLILSSDGNSDYKLISDGSVDNIVLNSDVKYFLSEGSITSNGEASYVIDSNTRYEDGKEVLTYTIDKAGNKSDEVKKTLVIKPSGNDDIDTSYMCSLDNSKYETNEEATQACTKTIEGEITSKTVWFCKNGEIRDNFSCFEQGTVTKTYICDDGWVLDPYTNTCTGPIKDTKEVTGSITFNLICRANEKGFFTWQIYGESDSTKNGCPYGYNNDYWICKANIEEYNGDGYQETNNYNDNKCTSIKKNQIISNQVSICTNYCSKILDASEQTTKEANQVCTCSVNDNASCDVGYCYRNYVGEEKTKYTCSINNLVIYDNEELAKERCKTTEEGTVNKKYYCNNVEYNSESEAISACSNYCETGSYYKNACYSFN